MTKPVELHSSIAGVNKMLKYRFTQPVFGECSLWCRAVYQGFSFLVCALGSNVCLLCLVGPAPRPHPDEDSDQQVV